MVAAAGAVAQVGRRRACELQARFVVVRQHSRSAVLAAVAGAGARRACAMRATGSRRSGGASVQRRSEIEAEKDRIAPQLELFKAMGAPCIVYGETAGTIQGDQSAPLARKLKLDEAQIKEYGRKMTVFAEWCAAQGMPLSYHHHMAAPIETEAELDLLMAHSGAALPLLFDAGHMAFAGGDVLRVIDTHHARINHVHTKDIRGDVIAGLDRSRHSFLDAVIKGAFTVPGDGSLDFDAIVQRLAAHGYEGWFVVEAEQDPIKNPPLKMAQTGHQELLRVMKNAGYSVEA